MCAGGRRLRIIAMDVDGFRSYSKRQETTERLLTGKVDIACIQETHDLDAHGETVCDYTDYTIYASTDGAQATENKNNTKGIGGLSLIIRTSLLQNITEVRKIDERIMYIRFKIPMAKQKRLHPRHHLQWAKHGICCNYAATILGKHTQRDTDRNRERLPYMG